MTEDSEDIIKGRLISAKETVLEENCFETIIRYQNGEPEPQEYSFISNENSRLLKYLKERKVKKGDNVRIYLDGKIDVISHMDRRRVFHYDPREKAA